MKRSAGILLYRRAAQGIEFLLVHPGGPFWAKKDEHAWSVPKGETGETGKAGEAGETGETSETGKTGAAETLEATARREFFEETGQIFEGNLTPLPSIKAPGKMIHAFLGEGDFDPATLRSNMFEMEWPPKSGRLQSFPEVDNSAWFDAEIAKKKIHKGQVPLVDAAIKILNARRLK